MKKWKAKSLEHSCHAHKAKLERRKNPTSTSPYYLECSCSANWKEQVTVSSRRYLLVSTSCLQHYYLSSSLGHRVHADGNYILWNDQHPVHSVG